LIQPQRSTAKPVSLNWFECRFISFHFRKSNKKTAAFLCQRFRNLPSGFPGSQSLSLLQVIRTRFKTDCAFQLAITFTVELAILLCYRLVVNTFLIFSRRTHRFISVRPLQPVVHPQTRFSSSFRCVFLPPRTRKSSTLAHEQQERSYPPERFTAYRRRWSSFTSRSR